MRLTHPCLLIAAFLLTACGLAVPVTEAPTEVPTSAMADPLPVPTPTGAPLRLVLPTPGVEPVSGWRPPLYPIPWAVSSYDHFYFARPNPADQVNWPLADYRYGQMFFANVVHTGVDIDAFEGSPVLAAGPGTERDPYRISDKRPGHSLAPRGAWGRYTCSPLYSLNSLTQHFGRGLQLRNPLGFL